MELKPGVYRHYKNKNYSVIGCAKHTETGEEFIVYRALYGAGELWARPKDMFMSEVTVEGRTVPRFQFIGDSVAEDTSGEQSTAT